MINTMTHPWVLAEGNTYAPGAPPYNPSLSDPIYIYYSMKHYLKDCFNNSILPLWNPNSFCGYPFMTKIVGDMYNPLDFMFLIFPVTKAFGYSAAFHLFLAGIFMYAFARSLKVPIWGSLFAAIAFMFNANTILWLEFPTHLKGELWIPLIFLFIIKYFKEKKIIFSLLAGLFLGMQILTMSNQVIQFTVVALGLILVVNIIYDLFHKNYIDIFKKIGATALAGAIGFLIGSCYLFPFYKEFINSQRAAQVRSGGGNLNFRYLLALLNPNFFGSLTAGKFWLRGTNFIESVRYSGVITLILAGIAVFFRRGKNAIVFSSILVITVLINSVPLVYSAFNTVVPFFDKSGISRMLMLVPFSLAILAAMGISYLQKLQEGKIAGNLDLIRRRGAIFSLSFGILFIAIMILSANIFSTNIDIGRIAEHPVIKLETFSFILFLVLAIISTAIVVGIFIFKRFRKFLIILIVPLIVADLFTFGMNINTVSEENQIFFKTPAIEYIKSDKGVYRIVGITGGTLSPNSPWVFNLQDIGGYDPIMPEDYSEFWANFQGPGYVRPNGKVGADKMDKNFLALTNTRYIMSYGYLDNNGYFVENLDKMLNREEHSDVSVNIWNFNEYIIPTIVVPPDSNIKFNYHIGEGQKLSFYLTGYPQDWGQISGDGVVYSIFIEYGGKKEKIFQNYLNPIEVPGDREWKVETIDLSKYANRDVTISFTTSSKNSTDNDMPGWGNPKIITAGGQGDKGLVLKYDREAKIYRNYDSLPRAFLAGETKIYNDNNLILEQLVENHRLDLKNTVFLLDQGNEKIKSLNTSKKTGNAEIMKYSNNYVKINTESQTDNYLVLLDRYDDDWKVYVDGEQRNIIKANFLFRAVYVGKGSHVVEFRYQPKWFKYSVLFSLAVLIAVLTAIICLYWKKYRKGKIDRPSGLV
ncbi:MAG: YfhO family protein [Actinomycetia bacterium]|nr:YfhO family protein [Actinomycetes bacterium]